MEVSIQENLLRYDIHVPPGANPEEIRFRIQGQRDLHLNGFRELVIGTSMGDLLFRRLYAYQEVRGERRQVECGFTFNEKGDLGFKVGAYDPRLPLVIDPLVWSTFAGGIESERTTGIARSSSGEVYLTGYTTSSNFPVTPGAYSAAPGGSTAAFITKVHRDGSTLLYSALIGGAGGVWSQGIALASNGAVCITGYAGEGMPTTQGAYRRLPAGDLDAFALKLNAPGTALDYSTYLGGRDADRATSIALDTAGRMHITGGTLSSDFPATVGAYDQTHNGQNDLFVSLIRPSGAGENDLIYSSFMGGPGSENGYTIAVGGQGDIYLAGVSSSSLFPTTYGAFDRTHNGDSDGVVVRLLPAGNGENDLVYASFLGGAGADRIRGLALQPSGVIALTGSTASYAFPVTSGGFDTTYNSGGRDIFCALVRPAGAGDNDLIYGTFIGGSGSDEGNALVLNTTGHLFVIGTSTSTNFPASTQAYDRTHNGDSDVVILKVRPQGAGDNDLVYATYVGGGGADEGLAIAIGGGDSLNAGGGTGSSDFPTTTGSYDSTQNGKVDAFALLLIPESSLTKPSITDGSEPDRPGEMEEAWLQCVPNPVRGKGMVRFRLRYDGPARLEIYSAEGNLRTALLDAPMKQGEWQIGIDVRELPPGRYWLRLTTAREGRVFPLTVIR